MKCRVGDLAIVHGAHDLNNGKIVQCLKFIGSGEGILPAGTKTSHIDLWLIDKPLVWWSSLKQRQQVCICPDRLLIPLHDGLLSEAEVKAIKINAALQLNRKGVKR